MLFLHSPSLPRFLRFGRWSWAGRIAFLALATLVTAGCDLSGLTGQSCTPTTCDYVVNTLVAAQGSGGVALLADSNNNFYTFSGSTWTKVSTETATQRGPLFASPNFATDQTVFLGNSVSTDGGKDWTILCAVVTAVSPNFGADKTVFGVNALVTSGGTSGGSSATGPQGCPSAQGGYYLSKDGGQSWNAANGPTGTGRPDLFVISPKFGSDKTIFATFSENKNQQPVPALYRSTNGGADWTKVLDGKQDLLAVSPDYSADRTVITVGPDKAQISTNGGANWKALTLPIATTQSSEIAFSPAFASDQTLLLASGAADSGSQKGTYLSTDGGATWSHPGPVAQRGQNFPAIVFSPNYASDKTIYTSSLDQGQGPAKSTDNGANWSAINGGLDLVAGLGG